ncbi:unnamed protein product, partial [Closterium sp. NIES-53]
GACGRRCARRWVRRRARGAARRVACWKPTVKSHARSPSRWRNRRSGSNRRKSGCK